MMLLALSDANIAAIISLVGVIFSGAMTVFLALLNHGQHKAAAAVNEVAEKLDESTTVTEEKLEKTAVAVEKTAVAVEGVSTALSENTVAIDEKLTEIAKTGVDTHKLVNSQMGTQLELNLSLAKQVLEMTKDPKLKALAEEAVVRSQAALDDHIGKQSRVDQDK